MAAEPTEVNKERWRRLSDFAWEIFGLSGEEGFEEHVRIQWEPFFQEDPEARAIYEPLMLEAWNLAQYRWAGYVKIMMESEKGEATL